VEGVVWEKMKDERKKEERKEEGKTGKVLGTSGKA
jgi:hypothetical protein